MKEFKEIPFLDLTAPHRELEEELVEMFREALRSGRFVGGPHVEAFEADFARYCDARHSVGVASGTDALRLALLAAGVKSGDSVVTVPNTFIATTEAISQAGAHPEFVDVDGDHCNLDPLQLAFFLSEQCTRGPGNALRSKRTGRPVTAVVPVHLYGQPAPMDEIMALAEEFDLLVIEDAAQAHGAEYFRHGDQDWRRVGGLAHVAAFSFYPGKNLGACGEAGAVTTDDPDIARRVRMLRDHGQASKYHHEFEGYNARLDAIQAGVLRIKLRHLPEWTARRRACARRYGQLLQDCASISLPAEPAWARAVYHLYVIRTENRSGLADHLRDAGVATGLHYPRPLHLQPAYRHLGLPVGSFPVAEQAARDVLSLPMFPTMPASQQRRVTDLVRSFASGLVPEKATL